MGSIFFLTFRRLEISYVTWIQPVKMEGFILG